MNLTSLKFFEIKENSSEWKLELSEEDAKIYGQLWQSIVEKDFFKYHEVAKENGILKKIINKIIFVQKCEANIKDGICHAMTLCHLAAIHNAQKIMRHLLMNGGDLSKQYLEINKHKKIRRFIKKDSVFALIIIHFREPIGFLTEMLNSGITCEDKLNDYEFYFDFSMLSPYSDMAWTVDYIQENCVKQMNVLNAIINSSDDIHSEQYELLKHPLIESYLACKWKHYRRYFFLLVLMHMFFVSCLSTAVILIVKNFQWFHNETIITLVTRNFSHLTEESECQRIVAAAEMFHYTMNVIRILNLFAFLTAIFLFIHAVIQASFIPVKKLFFEFEILLNLLTALCAMLTCICFVLLPYEGYFDENYRWIYHVSSCIILPVWMNLMLLIGRFPRLGCYSLMFTTVLKNFLKVMISFVFLIIGFALSFSLVFPKSDSFIDPAQATLRTIVMMVGEFDYMDTFSDEQNHFISGTSRFIFLIFIISCSIILMNLTQGIAVNDIKLLHEISQEIRLEKETRFLYELECVFTHPIMTSHPFFRKIKRKLYDHGTKIETLRVSRDNKQGLSTCLYDKLVKEHKPNK